MKLLQHIPTRQIGITNHDKCAKIQKTSMFKPLYLTVCFECWVQIQIVGRDFVRAADAALGADSDIQCEKRHL